MGNQRRLSPTERWWDFSEPWNQFLARGTPAHLCGGIPSSEEGCSWARRRATHTSVSVFNEKRNNACIWYLTMVQGTELSCRISLSSWCITNRGWPEAWNRGCYIIPDYFCAGFCHLDALIHERICSSFELSLISEVYGNLPIFKGQKPMK